MVATKTGNLVHQTTIGTGNGNLILVDASGKRSFNTHFGNGATTDVFYYFISHQTMPEWEVGTGHMSAATTLVRDTVLQSSNANAKVIFSPGTKDVVNDIAANYQYQSYLPQSVVGPFLGSGVLPIATTGNFPGVSATSSRGTEASPTQLATGDLIGKYDFWGWMGSATPAYVPMAGWYAKVNGATTNDKGADLLLYQKTDNNIGYYNTWKFANTGQLFSGGYYNHIGIMTSQNDGGFLSGALNTQDPSYFLGDNTYQMCFNDPATGGIGSAHGVFAATGLNGTYLTLGASGYGEAYNGIFQYAQPGAAVWDVHDLNDISIFYFTDTGIARFNDGFFTRLGTTIGPSTAGQAGDGALNIYQEGGGSYWQLWLDKSDVVRGSYSDGLFDVMDADVNTNKNITCLNLQASNLVVGNTISSTGSVLAASSFEGPDVFFTGLSTPGFASDGFMWYDTVRKATQTFSDGIKQTLSGCIFTQTADKTVANTVTETSIIGTGVGGLTLPANFFVAGKTIRATMSGVYSTVAVTGDTVTIKIKYGSTVLASKATTALVTGGTNLYWSAEVLITCRTTGTTGTVQVSGGIEYQIASAVTVTDELNNGAATTTLNTTTANLLDITVTHSAANASNTVKSLVGTFEVIN